MLKDPEQRYRSARAFSRDLRHWLDDNLTSPEGDAPVPAGAKSRGFWVRGALAGLVVGGVALAVVLAPRQKTAQPAPVAVAIKDGAARAAAPPLAAASVATAAPIAASAAVAPVVSTTVPAAVPAIANSSTAADTASRAVAPNAPAAEKTPVPASVTTPVTKPASAKTSSATAPVAAKPSASQPKPGSAALKPVAPQAAPQAAAAKASPSTAKRVAETREAEAKAAAQATPPVANKPNGTLKIAISPWGQVEVDGVPAGTTPPLNELTLPEGKHQIVIRNGDFPPFRTIVTVNPGQSVTVKHKFGS